MLSIGFLYKLSIMETSANFDRFKAFVESLTDDVNLRTAIFEGYSACFEAHEGIIRNLDAIVIKYNLAAKDWDSELKKEIYTGIDHTITGRGSLDSSGKNIGKLKDLSILDTKFSNPSIISLTMADLDSQTIRNMRERIELLFVDPTQKVYKISKVPNDIQRYYTQYAKVKSGGASALSPVIFINRNGKYELYEGNHRLLVVIKIAIEQKVDELLLSRYDVSKLIQEEVPGLKARIFRSIPDSDISFSINAYIGTPPIKSIASIIKDAVMKLFRK